MFKLCFVSHGINATVTNERLSYFDPIIDALDREKREWTFYDSTGKVLAQSISKDIKEKEERIKKFKKSMGDIPKHH